MISDSKLAIFSFHQIICIHPAQTVGMFQTHWHQNAIQGIFHLKTRFCLSAIIRMSYFCFSNKNRVVSEYEFSFSPLWRNNSYFFLIYKRFNKSASARYTQKSWKKYTPTMKKEEYICDDRRTTQVDIGMGFDSGSSHFSSSWAFLYWCGCDIDYCLSQYGYWSDTRI